MLCLGRIDISEGIDVKKMSKLKERDICHHRYFLDKEFKFQSNISNGYHDVLMVSMNLSDVAVLNIHNTDYCCIISGISKSGAINLMQNIDLTKTIGTL